MLKVQEIRELIKLIDQSSINEFTYETDGATVSMKKTGSESVVHKEVVQAPSKETPIVSTPSEPVITEDKAEDKTPAVTEVKKESSTDYDHEIVSPMVGTFYSSPSPESDPYVSKGSTVKNDSVVCIVEAMKLFNEIEAEVSGEIVEVLVENGELVEYGQPLFRVKTK
ncbi:acetyl-CoA carboxylase biotin carboxyl carrier protein [Oceanobacillus halophilus]|uniref:Biotin carboxyl carrier protein of acetyl-CoA carboxylase n=1 Tax=Oceanobacillus halophilus TaxID=930130 RepID=A0A495AGI5_9BACI|nr:acetyl-CoA carboxylase biotin carboxyl carrier protein [Oceanobacillus halophilus]RKQ37755.1 acetyl-CoA carboxylase biotin carboxyl carrier protein [Oceanobacillus halophilus]